MFLLVYILLNLLVYLLFAIDKFLYPKDLICINMAPPTTLEIEAESNTYAVDLPMKRFSVLSHQKNIDFAIEQIKRYAGDVIGYFRMRGLGTRETLHQVLTNEAAERLKHQNPEFDYVTLDDLLRKRKDISEGKYVLDNGLIISRSY